MGDWLHSSEMSMKLPSGTSGLEIYLPFDALDSLHGISIFSDELKFLEVSTIN